MNTQNVKLIAANQKVTAKHGVICSYPQEFFGYFGWPSVAMMKDGTLVVVASGMRNAHVCPFGRTVFLTSKDEGLTWTSPRIINDTPLDDRDAGVTVLSDDELLVSMFTCDYRKYTYYQDYQERDEEFSKRYQAGLRWVDDETVSRWLGSWVRKSSDGGETWGDLIRVPLTTPHGPICMHDGSLLYFGKAWDNDEQKGYIQAFQSQDKGKTWDKLGEVPLYPGTHPGNYHEPHVAELHNGKLIGHIRVENQPGTTDLVDQGITSFSIMQTISEDGGRTWSTAIPFNFHGSPPHLIQHSSGALICVYGYRLAPCGQRVMISYDEGTTWKYDYLLRDDGFDFDLGYPSSVELKDGSIFTIYYQKANSIKEKCSLLWSRWELPK